MATIFQIVAEAPVDDFGTLERIQKSLTRSFNVDLTPYRAQLRRGGVCVVRADSLEAAEAHAEQVRSIGANYRILDAQGRVVRSGEGRRTTDPPTRRDDPPTLLGGFRAPGAPVPAVPGPDTIWTSAESAGPADGSSDNAEPPDGSVELLGQASAGVSDRAAFNLDSLDVEDLVLLDGTKDEPAPPTKGHKHAAQPASFGPRVEEEDLELDEPVSQVGRTAAPEPPEAVAPAQSQAAVQEPPPVPPPSHAVVQARPAREPSRPPAPLAPPPVSVPSHAETPARPKKKPRPMFAAAMTPTSGGLLNGWFRARPRLRVAIGLALALGLGSIIPTCHARSVVARRIHPQLEDLSTAKAHGHLLSRLPNYRSPEEIEETISSIKTRYGVISFILWLGFAGALCFVWFRFA